MRISLGWKRRAFLFLFLFIFALAVRREATRNDHVLLRQSASRPGGKGGIVFSSPTTERSMGIFASATITIKRTHCGAGFRLDPDMCVWQGGELLLLWKKSVEVCAAVVGRGPLLVERGPQLGGRLAPGPGGPGRGGSHPDMHLTSPSCEPHRLPCCAEQRREAHSSAAHRSAAPPVAPPLLPTGSVNQTSQRPTRHG